ncbi:resolvase [Aeromonas caviae]|nr:resolvase [Aeromonas caviae]
MQQSLRRHAHLALVHTSIEHSRDWCRSLLILNCQELAAQQPLRPINWCSRLLKMTCSFDYFSAIPLQSKMPLQ